MSAIWTEVLNEISYLSDDRRPNEAHTIHMIFSVFFVTSYRSLFADGKWCRRLYLRLRCDTVEIGCKRDSFPKKPFGLQMQTQLSVVIVGDNFQHCYFTSFFFLVPLTHGMVLFVQHKSTVINHFAKFIICWTLLPAISQREALSFSPALYSMVTNCREPNLTSDANRIFDRFFSHHFVVVPAPRAHLSSICLRSAAAQQCPYLANRIFCVREHSSPKFTRY